MLGSDMRVIAKAKALAVHSFELTSNNNRYPKKYRHSLCDRIQLKSLDIHDTLLEANRIHNATSKRQRCEMITRAIVYCDELLFYIELSMSLGAINDKSVAFWSKAVTDVKNMSLAWRTKESK